MKDYYSILGVPPYATPTEIQRAFRRLALEYHPDVLGVPQNASEETIVQAYQEMYAEFYSGRTHDPGTAEILREITDAGDVLTDPERRRAYDLLPSDQQPPDDPEWTSHRLPVTDSRAPEEAAGPAASWPFLRFLCLFSRPWSAVSSMPNGTQSHHLFIAELTRFDLYACGMPEF